MCFTLMFLGHSLLCKHHPVSFVRLFQRDLVEVVSVLHSLVELVKRTLKVNIPFMTHNSSVPTSGSHLLCLLMFKSTLTILFLYGVQTISCIPWTGRCLFLKKKRKMAWLLSKESQPDLYLDLKACRNLLLQDSHSIPNPRLNALLSISRFLASVHCTRDRKHWVLAKVVVCSS